MFYSSTCASLGYYDHIRYHEDTGPTVDNRQLLRTQLCENIQVIQGLTRNVEMKKMQSGACGSYSFLFNCLLRIDDEVTRSLKLLRLWEGFLCFHPALFAASLILFHEDTGPTVDSNQRYRTRLFENIQEVIQGLTRNAEKKKKQNRASKKLRKPHTPFLLWCKDKRQEVRTRFSYVISNFKSLMR